MSKLKNIFALLLLVMAISSCTKESLVCEDQEDRPMGSAKTETFRTGDDGTDVQEPQDALPTGLPSSPDEAADGTDNTGAISDDDDDESDDDASTKRAAQNK